MSKLKEQLTDIVYESKIFDTDYKEDEDFNLSTIDRSLNEAVEQSVTKFLSENINA